MKKLVMVLVLAAIITTGAAFADHPGGLGIGVAFGYSGGWWGGYATDAALSLKLPGVPIFWAFKAGGWSNYLWLNVIGDYYLIDQNIAEVLGWYLGIGGYVNLGLGDPFNLGVGARIPIGLSIQPIPLLEIFLEIAPSLGVGIIPSFGMGGGWGGGFGLRLWF